MDDADRTLFQRAIAALSGQNHDPARDGLQALIQEHGRDTIVKAASDLDLGPLVSAEELAELAAAASGSEPRAGDGQGADDPITKRFESLEAKLDKLVESKSEDGKQADPLPEDELALVKAGVPVEAIEAAKPILSSQDEDARKAAFAMLAKQANPDRRSLLAKERGSAEVTPEEEAKVKAGVAALAKAAGDPTGGKTAAEQVLELLSRAANGADS